jgi:hypothetical protein
MNNRVVSAVAAFALTAVQARAADLHVGAGRAFAEIQAAIDAAAPGDTIFVAPGTYDVFTLQKPLSILGAGSGSVLVRDPDGALGCVVSNLPIGTQTVLAGFELGGPAEPSLSFANPDRLRIWNCFGRVTLHDLRAAMTQPQSYSPRILSVEDCLQVIVSRSQLLGTSVGPGGQIPLHAIDSDIWVVDCELRAGDNPLGTLESNPFGFTLFGGNHGSPGLRLYNSSARVARSAIVGGRGGVRVMFGSLFFPEIGGPALVTALSDCTIAGGPENLLRGGDAPPAPMPGFPYATLTSGGAAYQPDATVSFGTVAPSSVIAAADVVLEGGVNHLGVTASAFGAPAVALTVEPLARPTLRVADAQPPQGTSTALEFAGPANSVQRAHAALALTNGDPLPFGSLVLPLSAWPVATAALNGAGLARVPLAIPASPTLAGTPVWLQSVSLAAGHVALSEPAVLVIGA